jgi:hypothetical protein
MRSAMESVPIERREPKINPRAFQHSDIGMVKRSQQTNEVKQ